MLREGSAGRYEFSYERSLFRKITRVFFFGFNDITNNEDIFMKVKLTGAALALGLAMLPLASFAGGVGGGNANSNWTIYGWQNWSLDFRSVDQAGGERDIVRMEQEAANLGFMASIDTGVSVAGTPVKANFRCEQFTLWNRLANFSHYGWCNRNSKLGLSGPWGEAMFSSWLTPYNEITAQWIDPFYDAGSHTHSTLLGTIGWGTNYNNTGFDYGGYGGGVGGQGFMRRKDNLFQWFSPNWGGLQIRVGWSNNNRFAEDESSVTTGRVVSHTTTDTDDLSQANADLIHANIVAIAEEGGFLADKDAYLGGESTIMVGDQQVPLPEQSVASVTEDQLAALKAVYATKKLDPTILSIGVAYTASIGDDELWLGLGYQEHDEFAAVDGGLACENSNDETIRYAARYIHDWGNGHSTRISWAYEEMEYDWDYCAGGGDGPFNHSGNMIANMGNVDIERDAWLISGKHDFPGPLDFRFMYMEADDFECSGMQSKFVEEVDGADDMVTTKNCGGIDESSSGAEAFSVGLYYTMPAGTELRMVYGEVDNDANSRNGFGISSAGVVAGGDEESFQFGVVQWF